MSLEYEPSSKPLSCSYIENCTARYSSLFDNYESEMVGSYDLRTSVSRVELEAAAQDLGAPQWKPALLGVEG